MPQPRMCSMGHVIPSGALSCPFCLPPSNEGSSETRIDFTADATRVELPQPPIEPRPLRGWLAITEGKLGGEAFHLYEGRNTVGSSRMCNVQLTDPEVEDQHLSIRFSSGKCTVTDCDADGGTFVNGKRTYRAELKDGDSIRVGTVMLRVKMI